MESFKTWLVQKEAADAIVKSCKPTADAQVWGACSDLKKPKKAKK